MIETSLTRMRWRILASVAVLSAALACVPVQAWAQSPAVVINTPTVPAGGLVGITVTNGSATVSDWVTLVGTTSPDNAYVDWRYLNGLRTRPTTALTNTTLQMIAPAAPGTYEVRLYSNDGWTRLATSVNVTVATLTPAVTVNTPSVITGGTIGFSVAGGPANAADWVGLFPTGAADTGAVAWIYLNGTKTAPASGLAAATLQLTAPMTPGTYDLRLFNNNTFIRLATSGLVTVSPPPPTVTLNTHQVIPGGTISFTVANGPANISDWIALYPSAAGDTASVDWSYLNGLRTRPAAGLASATVQFTAPATPGTYNVRLFANDGWTKLATSDLVTVQPPTVTVNTPTVNTGGTISFTIADGPANISDWVALFPSSGADTASVNWSYLNGLRVRPAAGLAGATLQFTAPTIAGTYNVRLFANDGWTKLATSGLVTVAAAPTLSINDVSVAEGDSGTATATFTVTLNPVNTTQTVTVGYATANGTATAGSDYAAASGTLTFAPSVATQTLSVTVNGDTTPELDETILVNLTNPANALLGDSQGVATVTNDEIPTVTINTASPMTAEPIGFTVVNGPPHVTDWLGLFPAGAADTGAVAWMYLNGTKTPPGTPVPTATLQFAAPAPAGTYDIRLFANNEFTKLATSGPIAVRAAPTLTINDVSMTEGNSGTATATFTVALNPVNTTQTVTVDYATVNGTATAGTDYVAAAGTLTFAPSVATQTITVAINGDSVAESNESFAVNLTNVTNALVSDAQGVGTIADDDGPAVTINTPLVGGGGAISLSVARGPANVYDWVGLVPTGAPDTAYVTWSYLSGTKTPPATGVANATLQLTAPLIGGTYEVRLFSYPSGGTWTRIATSGPVTVQSGLSIGDVSLFEEHNGTATATFTVTLAPVNPTQTVTVDYATANGTATAGSDYVAASGTLTFAPSVTTRTISVTINPYTVGESNEYFWVYLSNPINALISDSQGMGTINSNRAPTISGPSLETQFEGWPVSFQVTGADPDGDPLTFSATGLPPGLAIGSTTGVVTGTLSAGAFGHFAPVVSVSDGQATASITIPWTVVGATSSFVFDSFSGPDLSDLRTHRADDSTQSGNWWRYGAGGPGYPTLLAGKLGLRIPVGEANWRIYGAHHDAIVAADISSSSPSPSGGLVLRYDLDTGNHFLLTLPGPSLYRVVQYQKTLIYQPPTPQTVVPGREYRLEAEITNQLIQVFWNGTLLYSVNDAMNSDATYHGVFFDTSDVTFAETHDTTFQFDNFEISAPNRAPAVAPLDDQLNLEGTSATLQAVGSDNEGTPLTYSATGLPAGLSINATTGLISGTLAGGSGGVRTVVVNASDGTLTGSRAFVWRVLAPSPTLIFDAFGSTAEYLSTHQFTIAQSAGNWQSTLRWHWLRGNFIPEARDGSVRPGISTVNEAWTTDVGLADVSLAVDVHSDRALPQKPYAGLVFRASDSDNYFLLRYQGPHLYRRVNGDYIEIVPAAPYNPVPFDLPFNQRDTHHLGVRATGDLIEVYSDGALLFTTTQSFNHNATRHGLLWDPDSDPTATFDNFELRSNQTITSIPTPPPCQITLSPSPLVIRVGAGNGTYTDKIHVTNQPDCGWGLDQEADRIPQIWRIPTGPNTWNVAFVIVNNTSPNQRTIHFAIAGNTQAATVIQDAGGGCNAVVTPSAPVLGASAHTGLLLTVTGNCDWIPQVAGAFIHVTDRHYQNNAGWLTYDLDANTGATSRQGSITINNTVVTVTQLSPGETPIPDPEPTDTETSYYFTDAIGSVRLITDDSGNVKHRYDYIPSGVEFDSESFHDRRMFAGKEHDSETGSGAWGALDYFGARYYQSQTGRFTSTDPSLDLGKAIVDPQQWNRYVYARNNPLKFTDPDGREILSVVDGKVVMGPGNMKPDPERMAWAAGAYGAVVAVLFAPEVILAGVTTCALSPSCQGEVIDFAEGLAGGPPRFNGIGSTGRIGEDALKALGGQSKVFFKTSDNARFVDQFVNGIAHESKVGYQALTKSIKRQIAKDVELMKNKDINGAVWHFYTSPVTGKGGPSAPLRQALEDNGIGIAEQ